MLCASNASIRSISPALFQPFAHLLVLPAPQSRNAWVRVQNTELSCHRLTVFKC